MIIFFPRTFTGIFLSPQVDELFSVLSQTMARYLVFPPLSYQSTTLEQSRVSFLPCRHCSVSMFVREASKSNREKATCGCHCQPATELCQRHRFHLWISSKASAIRSLRRSFVDWVDSWITRTCSITFSRCSDTCTMFRWSPLVLVERDCGYRLQCCFCSQSCRTKWRYL